MWKSTPSSVLYIKKIGLFFIFYNKKRVFYDKKRFVFYTPTTLGIASMGTILQCQQC